MDKINEALLWLEQSAEKQKSVALHEDPVFKVSEIDIKLKRVQSTFDRVSNTAKPKESTDKDKKKSGKKMPKNFKIDNMTFDGSSDINWEDFVNIQGGAADDSEFETENFQQQ